MPFSLHNPDLATDPAARRALKNEIVSVEFAAHPGTLASAVGLNSYLTGDALITGSTGDRWCVSRDRFDAKYVPVPPTMNGEAGRYRNRPLPVLAKHMDAPFSVSRTAGGDLLRGDAGDWLLQYGPGDHGIVERSRFERVYQLIPQDSPQVLNAVSQSPDVPTSDDRAIWDVWLSSVWLPSLSAAVELSIFETLSSGPADADELSKRLGLLPRRCEILLRMQVSLGYLVRYAGRYQLTDVARHYLLRESPFYWGHVWIGMPDNPMHRRLLEAVRAPSAAQGFPTSGSSTSGSSNLGSSTQGGATPAQAWESGKLDAPLAATIARFMNSHSMAAATGLARNGDFHNARRLLDVGGGSGCFSIALAQYLPQLRCTVMDLPAMCRLAEGYIAQGGVAERVDTVGVDMFRQAWPCGYDALFFSNIFHDWSFDTCAELAANARAALPKDGHIFLHEMLLDDTGCGPRAAAAFSVMMLFSTKGQQFTFSELQSLLEGAGFVNVTATPTYGYYSLVSARAP